MDDFIGRIKKLQILQRDPTPKPDSPMKPSDPEESEESEASAKSIKDRCLTWLKHFAIYLGAVTAACVIAIYAFWQLPILQDLPQLVKNVSDSRPDQSPANPAPSTLAGTKPAPSQPDSQNPVEPAPATDQPVAQTGMITVDTESPEPAENSPDPAVTPPTSESQEVPATTQAETPSATQPVTAEQPATAENATTPPTAPQEIQQLLVDAQQQISRRQLTSPASSNALRSYQRVLELEPTNAVATEGIQRITTYYQDIAKQSLLEGRTDEGLAYINRGLRAAPDNAILLNLRREARSAKQREDQQRQALLEERRRQEAQQQARRQEETRIRELPRQPSAAQSQLPWWQRQQQQPAFNESGFNQR